MKVVAENEEEKKERSSLTRVEKEEKRMSLVHRIDENLEEEEEEEEKKHTEETLKKFLFRLSIEMNEQYDPQQKSEVSSEEFAEHSVTSIEVFTDIHLKRRNSIIEEDSSVYLGVDWSDRSNPRSHCWISKNSSNHCECLYTLCQKTKEKDSRRFVQCGTCLIFIHEEHFKEIERTNENWKCIPGCRPSFVDQNESFDLHYWSSVSKLLRSCIRCQRKKFRPIFNKESEEHPFSTVSLKEKKGLICLWCSRYCHWECYQIIHQDNQTNKCDYGIYQNIIVRPQWLNRISESPSIFESRFSIEDDDESNIDRFRPLIVFINRLSGGQEGEDIYLKLIRLLNPRQVFLLKDNSSIEKALDIYSSLKNVRILICGGDGTVGWILSSLANRYQSLDNPPISICPLGTGNDLSRVFKWGSSYSKKQFLKSLEQISTAPTIILDHWKVQIESSPIPFDEREDIPRRCLAFLLNQPKFINGDENWLPYQNHRRPLNMSFTNYVSFGLDAAVVLDFHDKRIHHPSSFTSPLKNKLIYLNISRRYWKEFSLWRSWDLQRYMKLYCDGEDLSDSIACCHTIVLLNIPSYGSGTHPWNGERQNIGDGKIEVLGLDSIEMALIHIGFRGRSISQCHEVRIELKSSMPVHIDGDPFYLSQSTIVKIHQQGQFLVLTNEK